MEGILAVIAALLFIGSAVLALRTSMWVARTNLTQGVVRDNTVIFTAADGQERTFDDALPPEGAKVPVRYERDDPDQARVATTTRLWGTSMALSAAGTIVFLVAVS